MLTRPYGQPFYMANVQSCTTLLVGLYLGRILRVQRMSGTPVSVLLMYYSA